MLRTLPLAFFLACVSPADDSGHPHPPQPRDTADSGADTADSSSDSADTGAPTCGDGRVDAPHEECDGADDSSCAGRCASTCQCPSMPASGTLELDVIDVWQGDGLLVVSPDGFVTLVDSGDSDQLDAVQKYLLSRGIPGVDYTVVSHQHADHMGAMGAFLDAHPEVGLAWDGGGTATTDAFDRYVRAAGDRRTTIVKDDTLDLGGAMLAEVLHADVGSTDNENLNSVVLRLTYGNVRMLLGGDCETWGCERVFDPGPIDIYKVHHHGSSDSSGDGFLAEMQPKVALISVGTGNDYGHPDPGTLDRLAAVGADVWRTDQDGTIAVTTDGATWTVSAEKR